MDKAKVVWYADMFDRVYTVCENNTAIIEEVPALEDSYTNFKTKRTDVNARIAVLSIRDNGSVAAKNAIWDSLAGSLETICAGLRVYATKVGNLELRAQAQYAPSVFTNERGTEAIATGTRLLALANTHIASLAVYNITPAQVTTATTQLTQLAVANPKPLTNRSTKKALLELLIKQVKETRNLLKLEIDEFVRTFKTAHPAFYGEYFAARRIVHTGIRHKQTEEEAETKKQEEEAKKQDAAQSKEAAAVEGGLPDTNGTSPPGDAPSGGEGQREGEG